MSCMLLTGATSENWRAASPPGGTTLTVAALIKTDRKSGGWAKNKTTINTEEDCLRLFLKCMERLMDQHERLWQTDDGCVILFVHFADFFPVSSPLLDILLERFVLGYFGAPSEEGHSVTTPFLLQLLTFLNLGSLPSFLTFIPKKFH